MSEIKVTIISIWHNRENLVDKSIESVLNQSFKNYELILWDDRSDDQTFIRLKKFDKAEILVKQSPKNQGLTACLIQAIEMSKGKFIAIHGAGDTSLPTRIEEQANFLNSHPRVVAVGCKVENYWEKTGKTRIFPLEIEKGPKKRKKIDPYRSNPFTHGEVMFRMDSYEKVGGYREFFRYSQDRDLWCRLAPEGEFSRVDKILYRRILFNDGASYNPVKRMHQAAFSEIAKISFKETWEGRLDPIKQPRELVLAYIPRSKSSCRRLYNTAFECFSETKGPEIFKELECLLKIFSARNLLAKILFVLARKYPKFIGSLINVKRSFSKIKKNDFSN